MEVKAGDFVKVVVETLEKDGIPQGSYLYLAGDTLIRETEDPYLYRKVFVAARIVDSHINADEKPFLVAGKSVELVSFEEEQHLTAVYNEDFGKEEEPSNA